MGKFRDWFNKTKYDIVYEPEKVSKHFKKKKKVKIKHTKLKKGLNLTKTNKNSATVLKSL